MYFDFMEKNPMLPNKIIHFVGIGGIGMSSIANLLFSLGFKVQGSDISVNSNIERLKQLGIKVIIGHNENNIDNADIIVISSAIKESNVEYKAAKERKLPIYKRGRVLGEIMSFYYGIAVTGAHGKTTTTSLIGEILSSANLEPTVVVGGVVNSWQSNLKIGKSKFFVAEADESDGSFLKLPSIISVVTNIESEHLDYYKTHEYLVENFVNFVNKVPFFGKAILCIEDKGVKNIINFIKNTNIITYGLTDEADYIAKDILFTKEGAKFNVIIKHKGSKINNIKTKLYGTHNILNTLSAIAVADTLGIDKLSIKNGLKNFNGVNRRFTKVGEYNEVQIVDDYAHHPSEIRAVLKSAKDIVKNSNIIAIVQPHRYTRLRDCFNEFISVLQDADFVILLPVYAAGEKIINGFDSKSLYLKLQGNGHKNTVFIEDNKEVPPYLKKIIKKDDMIICMGAGDITNLARNLQYNLENIKDND